MSPIIDLLRSFCPALSVGVISADLMDLGRDIRVLEESGGVLAHFDVMDGLFVPQLTAGPFFVKAVRTKLLKDVHLMVERPLESLDAYAAAGADTITVSVESTPHAHRALQRVHELRNVNDPDRGIAAGVGLNPGTPLSVLAPLVEMIDVVTILAVNPGFGGQKFLDSAIDRCRGVREIFAAAGKPVLVCVDGGVTVENIDRIAACSPDLVVSGSAVFGGKGAAENIRSMTGALRKRATAVERGSSQSPCSLS